MNDQLSLTDKDAVIRYHAALRSRASANLWTQLAKETDPDVKTALAWSLLTVGTDEEVAIAALGEVIESDHAFSRVLALNALDYVGEPARPLLPRIQEIAAQKETRETINESWLAKRILTQFP